MIAVARVVHVQTHEAHALNGIHPGLEATATLVHGNN